MRKNRIGYLLLVVTLGILLFFFQKTYLLLVIAGFCLLAVLFGILLQRDKERIVVTVDIPQGKRVGKTVVMTIDAAKKGKLCVAGGMIAEIELYHIMYGISIPKKLILPLSGDKFHYEIPIGLEYCGEVCVRCNSLHISDLLGLFSVALPNFRQPTVMVYPERINLNVEIAPASIGTLQNDGYIQNRKGTDPSEIFDLRDYMPGDDVRSIHWKLSGKIDHLVVKQASDPTHFQIVLMPDLACGQMEEEMTIKQLNTAVSICAGMGERLLEQGKQFYMALPTMQGLSFYEIRSSKEFQDAMYVWMSIELPKKEGMGLKYFITEHMEQYFSKVIVISAGRYLQALDGLDGKIGMTIISAVEGKETLHVKLNSTCDVVEIPVEQDKKTVYHVLC